MALEPDHHLLPVFPTERFQPMIHKKAIIARLKFRFGCFQVSEQLVEDAILPVRFGRHGAPMFDTIFLVCLPILGLAFARTVMRRLAVVVVSLIHRFDVGSSDKGKPKSEKCLERSLLHK